MHHDIILAKHGSVQRISVYIMIVETEKRPACLQIIYLR